ncbi:hypothetical protein R3I94_000385 [Phoxinus phoxinus]
MSPDSNNSASAANDSASAANDSASAANDSASAANDSASAANDSASAANVFYMPTQRKRRQIHNANECSHNSQDVYHGEVVRERVREGRKEFLFRWQPCTSCGKKWRSTWVSEEAMQ